MQSEAGDVISEDDGDEVVAPDPSSVVDAADDRAAPEATLREPDGESGDGVAKGTKPANDLPSS